MRLPDTAHTSRPWRIHDLVADFRLEDVWELPTPGGPDGFPRLVEMMTGLDPFRSPSRVVRVLFTIRQKVGDRLGLDKPADGVGSRVATVRDRLPADLVDARGPDFKAVPFTAVYATADEYAAELANRTVHGVMHLSWVQDASGGYRGRMAVYVKPNGPLGRVYMAVIGPFRRVLYPPMMRAIGRSWKEAVCSKTSTA